MTTIATFKEAGGSAIAQIEIGQRHEPASAKQAKQTQATCSFILAI
ncbi:hypothetical protein [Comamonas suwonensis]|uniref:Uncharacterized protein n=1 Tax=Comamonas suwonensis TaxID=2606214 RepID=A0A843BC43_9BURK|nr:hypothetical protein [Comamonas suwonensis]MBI1626810.1 hypothetical protein [Comamonas suwonensis]